MEGLKKQRIADFLRISSGYGSADGSADGYGGGYGSADGYGGGYGSADGYGGGYGYGSGYGSADGSGDGSGYGSADGSGDGSGYADGSGYGGGSGSGYGYGGCSGSGYGYGSGYADGYGGGSGDDIKSFCGKHVYMVDSIPTIIDRVTGGIAKGRILHSDLTTTPCFVVKDDGLFAHGDTLREAMDSLREKQFENMPEDERIEAFISTHERGKRYPCADLYDWHHRLTGSCEMGRREFAKDHGIDIEHDSMTVDEFIDLTLNAYGGGVIRALKRALDQRRESQ